MPGPLKSSALRRWSLAAILWIAAFPVLGEDYLGRDEFLGLVFGSGQPEQRTLWLTKEQKAAAKAAVGWAPVALRLRYWQSGTRTAWILEDIGKEKPITLGVAIDGQKIERVDVLAFRESRGWEIRYPFFTSQFSGLGLNPDGYLSESVDGITGATLSVRATERMARLALWLDAQVQG
ncbi:MAG: FMN-binding protein [Halioglobus sp.]|nr:FMN-binding protein [Halioglobus sp.]